jgi:hypothetical protein
MRSLFDGDFSGSLEKNYPVIQEISDIRKSSSKLVSRLISRLDTRNLSE